MKTILTLAALGMVAVSASAIHDLPRPMTFSEKEAYCEAHAIPCVVDARGNIYLPDSGEHTGYWRRYYDGEGGNG